MCRGQKDGESEIHITGVAFGHFRIFDVETWRASIVGNNDPY